MSSGNVSLNDVLDWYSDYLRNKHPKNANRFNQTRQLDYEAAVAEAITFNLLTYMRVEPDINDQVGTGGADFICCASSSPFSKRLPRNHFVVEATSLNPDAVTKRSRIPKDMPQGVSGGAIGLLTQNICNKAKDKKKQLEGYPMPRVLTIVSSHAGASVLINAATAKWALISEEHFQHEIGSSEPDPNWYTDLKQSVFMERGPDGSILPRRKEISAILLVAVDGGSSEVFGILHPEPEYPLNIAFLPNLPFVHIANWPASDGRLLVQWVIADPAGLNVRHYQIARKRFAAAP